MPKHYPTIKNSLVLLLILFIIICFLTLIAIIIAFAAGMGLDQLKGLFNKYPLLLGVINLIGIGLITAWGFKRAKAPFSKVFPFRAFPVSMLIPISLVILGLSILLSDLDNWLRWALKMPIASDDFLVALANSKPWISFIVLVIVAPLTEEFLFRGVILTGFLNNYSVKKAIWVSALLFGIL